MSPENRASRREIISSILALIDLLPEKDLEIIESALEKGVTDPALLKESTGVVGPQADVLSAFLKNLPARRDALLLALQTALAARGHAQQNIETCDLIWTGPIQFPIPARSTLAVMQEMIVDAKDSITIIGYRVEEYAEPIIRSLYDSAKRDVKIRLVIDRAESQLSIFKKIWAGHDLPEVYYRKSNAKDPMASIHAKLIVVDASDMLVTSANLTYHGLSANLEIGIRVRGKTAGKAERLITDLITNKQLVHV